eukprot:gene5604-6294_t
MSEDLFGEVVVIKRNGSDGARFPFRKSHCTFGRNQECDVRIQLPNVSQEHAKMHVEEGKILLQNLSDIMPTLLNEKEFQVQELKHNDVFTISERSFRFELPVRRKSTPKRRSTAGKTPLKALQGSPRTPKAGQSLKKSIKKLRKSSSVVEEEDEDKQTPKTIKAGCSTTTPELSCFDFKENTPEDQLIPTTPSILKKRVSISAMDKKRVSFGSSLSPELFDKSLPPSTPLRKGKSPSRRMSEPVQRQTPRLKKTRSSAGTNLSEMAIVEEDVSEEDCEGMVGDLDAGKFSMAVNDVSSHVMALADTPPQGLAAPLISTLSEVMEQESSDQNGYKGIGGEKIEPVVPIGDVVQNGLELEKKRRKLATPLRNHIKEGVNLRATKHKMFTPLRKQINAGVSLMPTRRRMHTPLRKDIQSRPHLKQILKKMATPLKRDIESKPQLKSNKRRLNTPLRKDIKRGVRLAITKPKMNAELQEEILMKPKLKETKKKLATPLRQQIKEKRKLRPTMKKMATPLRREIESAPKLKETKMCLPKDLQEEIVEGIVLRSKYSELPILPSDVKNDIQKGRNLRKTLLSAATPLREEIKRGITLRKTKKVMDVTLQSEIKSGIQLKKTKLSAPTPLKKEIKAGKELRKTKPTAPTPFRDEIKKGLKLRETKKKLAADLQNEIQEGKQLKKTKLSAPTPLKEEIKSGKVLRKTKPTAPTPFRNEIKKGLKLRETKKKLAADLQNEIQEGKQLKKTKLSAPTPLKEEIKSGKVLRKTKPTAPTPFRNEIKKGLKLRETKKKLAADLQNEIQEGKQLKKTKLSAPTPLKEEIKSGKVLRKTKPTAPTPFRNEIKKGLKLRETKKKLAADLQNEIQEGKQLKRTKLSAPTPLKKEIKAGKELRKTKPTAPTPFRNEIKKGLKLRETKRQLGSSLQNDIKVGKLLRPVLQKSLKTPIRAQIRAGVNLCPTSRRSSVLRKEPISERRKSLRSSTKDDLVQVDELVKDEEPAMFEFTEEDEHAAPAKRVILQAKRRVKRLQDPLVLNLNFLEKRKSMNEDKIQKPARKRVCRRSTPKRFASFQKQAVSCEAEEATKEEETTESTGPHEDEKSFSKSISNSLSGGYEDDMSPVIAMQPVFFATEKEKAKAGPTPVCSRSIVSETSGEEESFVNDIPPIARLLDGAEQDLNAEDGGDDNENGEDNKEAEVSFVFEESPEISIELVKSMDKNGNGAVEENFGLKRLLKTPKNRPRVDSIDEDDLGLVKLMQTPREATPKQLVEVNCDLSNDQLVEVPDSDHEECIEAPCLDGLIQITKMPIHEGDGVVCKEENESPVKVGVLPKLFKTPKLVQSPVADFYLQGLFPEVTEKDTVTVTEVTVIVEKKTRSLNERASQPKEEAQSRRSKRQVKKEAAPSNVIVLSDSCDETPMDVAKEARVEEGGTDVFEAEVEGGGMEKVAGEEGGAKVIEKNVDGADIAEARVLRRGRSRREQHDVPKHHQEMKMVEECQSDEPVVVSSRDVEEEGEQVEERDEMQKKRPASKRAKKGGRSKAASKKITQQSLRDENEEKVVKEDPVEVVKRSRGRKSIELVVKKISERLSRQMKNEVEEEGEKEAVSANANARRPVRSSRRGSSKSLSDAGQIKDDDANSAGVTKGVVVTPVKIIVQRTKLGSIPEEHEENLKTPACKPVLEAKSNSVKASLVEEEEKHASQIGSQEIRKTRGRNASTVATEVRADVEVNEVVEVVEKEEKKQVRRSSRRNKSSVEDDVSLPATKRPTRSKRQRLSSTEPEEIGAPEVSKVVAIEATVSSTRSTRSRSSRRAEEGKKEDDHIEVVVEKKKKEVSRSTRSSRRGASVDLDAEEDAVKDVGVEVLKKRKRNSSTDNSAHETSTPLTKKSKQADLRKAKEEAKISRPVRLTRSRRC